jgi:crotonobetainyl-CoA:carnitine CoA-transferase CaiB-like acyl-CoA transferase
MTASRPKHILDGYKVLDFTQALAGPTVTRIFDKLAVESRAAAAAVARELAGRP